MNRLLAVQEDESLSIKDKKFIYFKSLLWMMLPSMIWSIAFGNIYVCIEPLFFPYLQHRITSKFSFLIKLVWVFAFLISILSKWNIRPDSYYFYLFVVLAGAPLSVLLTCLVFCVVMSGFLFSNFYTNTSFKFKKYFFLFGIFLIFLKFVFSIGDYAPSFIRGAIITPSPFAIKTLLVYNSFQEKNFLGITEGPTFLNYVKNAEKLPKKMVLLIVESWGESEASLTSIKKKLLLDGIKVTGAGFSHYHGSTLQGEIRELCSQYIRLDSTTNLAAMVNNCAPVYMKKNGYEVIAVHGYDGMFYARDTVWKRLGIDHSYFQSDMSALKLCPGPFLGICDAEMIAYGINLMRKKDKIFLYMLSISSHEPVAFSMVGKQTRYFEAIASIGNSQIIARNAVGSLVEVLRKHTDLGCTEVYVVGDHQAPSEVNNGRFPENQVPYLRMSFHCDG